MSTSDDIAFTIIPSNAGFTDQLLQFSTWYKFGLSLGYRYLHSTFRNTRPGAESIFDFLGFNEQFPQNALTGRERLYRRMGTLNRFTRESASWRDRLRKTLPYRLISNTAFRDFNFIDIGLGDTAPLEAGKDPVEALRDLIRATVARHATDNPKRRNLVRFYLTTGKLFFEQIAPALNQQTPGFPDRLDLRAGYFRHTQSHPMPSQFIDGKLKVLVHIRLGDTAILQTPWHTYVPLWAYWTISPLKEHADKSDRLFRKLMDVEDFAHFLAEFRTHFDSGELSTAVFSDGYKTAFKDLFASIDDLHLDASRLQALKQFALTYESQQFALFDDVENCVCRVGETNEDLQALIDAALNADIIIVGCHQRMIPKFLSTYYATDPAAQPVIIALHNGFEPRYAIEIGLDDSKADVFAVNISEAGYADRLAEIVEAVRQRHAPAARALP